jgi:hypothetical protein
MQVTQVVPVVEQVAQGEAQASQVGTAGTVFSQVPAAQAEQVLVAEKKPSPAEQAVHLVAVSTHLVQGAVQALQIGGEVVASRNSLLVHCWQVWVAAK